MYILKFLQHFFLLFQGVTFEILVLQFIIFSLPKLNSGCFSENNNIKIVYSLC